jgi:hypothetical protein
MNSDVTFPASKGLLQKCCTLICANFRSNDEQSIDSRVPFPFIG